MIASGVTCRMLLCLIFICMRFTSTVAYRQQLTCMQIFEEFPSAYELSTTEIYLETACSTWDRFVECGKDGMKKVLNPILKGRFKDNLEHILRTYDPICKNFEEYKELRSCMAAFRLEQRYSACRKIDLKSEIVNCKAMYDEITCRTKIIKRCERHAAYLGRHVILNAMRRPLFKCQCKIYKNCIQCQNITESCPDSTEQIEKQIAELERGLAEDNDFELVGIRKVPIDANSNATRNPIRFPVNQVRPQFEDPVQLNNSTNESNETSQTNRKKLKFNFGYMLQETESEDGPDGTKGHNKSKLEIVMKYNKNTNKVEYILVPSVKQNNSDHSFSLKQSSNASSSGSKTVNETLKVKNIGESKNVNRTYYEIFSEEASTESSTTTQEASTESSTTTQEELSIKPSPSSNTVPGSVFEVSELDKMKEREGHRIRMDFGSRNEAPESEDVLSSSVVNGKEKMPLRLFNESLLTVKGSAKTKNVSTKLIKEFKPVDEASKGAISLDINQSSSVVKETLDDDCCSSTCFFLDFKILICIVVIVFSV